MADKAGLLSHIGYKYMLLSSAKGSLPRAGAAARSARLSLAFDLRQAGAAGRAGLLSHIRTPFFELKSADGSDQRQRVAATRRCRCQVG
jgi:hypothetical protein